ncbi:uncharacterized protein BDR25DRAFT_355540 [Lindgomyces ingoldianus]|uniref:Uncharacterized protein n=1 Tax=Lindgomyces ingoldianus TaxID=673940 RepID=A0ACB6QWI0_9PLEO|nr:uncharacterized protein BDR25DRAFT_355540 [Lindgomyces ingoldianus]KAF2470437.1 hypothetical protein BDR25DRAFT_355540 [Lindgomyces ingoldianus]
MSVNVMHSLTANEDFVFLNRVRAFEEGCGCRDIRSGDRHPRVQNHHNFNHGSHYKRKHQNPNRIIEDRMFVKSPHLIPRSELCNSLQKGKPSAIETGIPDTFGAARHLVILRPDQFAISTVNSGRPSSSACLHLSKDRVAPPASIFQRTEWLCLPLSFKGPYCDSCPPPRAGAVKVDQKSTAWFYHPTNSNLARKFYISGLCSFK